MNNTHPSNLFELLEILEKEGVPKSEYWKRIGRFLESKTRKQHIPLHGNFELTPLCNFDCKMCYVHLADEQFKKKDLLPVSQWKLLADFAHRAGMQKVTLTGGECLTYPGFDELYVFLTELGLKVYIISNGYYMDKRRIKLLKSFKPASIRISIYGSSEEGYERVTGVRAFGRVYENIVNLRDAGFNLSLAITPSIYMKDDIKSLIYLAEDLHIKYGVNPQLMSPRADTGRAKNDLNIDEYLDIYHFLSSIHHEKLETVDWAKIPDVNQDGHQRFGIRCGAGRSAFGIKHDGSMCPCLSLEEITAKPLEIGFEQAWRQINNASEAYAIPLECGACVYQRHCLSCIAVHKDAPIDGHCDPAVCERMKRLVKEGFIPLKNIC